MELCVQLAIIFVGKQFLMSIIEYYLPMFWKLYNSLKLATATSDEKNKNAGKKSNNPQWVRDFRLAEWGQQGLFYEYLEMGKSIFVFDSFFPMYKNIFKLFVIVPTITIMQRDPNMYIPWYLNVPISFSLQ